jgi:hypothetical protein
MYFNCVKVVQNIPCNITLNAEISKVKILKKKNQNKKLVKLKRPWWLYKIHLSIHIYI